jgi:hypothetical protein
MVVSVVVSVLPLPGANGSLIDIESVDGQSAQTSPVFVEWSGANNVVGVARGLSNEEVYAVQILVCQQYDGRCRIAGSNVVPAPGWAQERSWRWQVSDVRFGAPDFGKGFQITALLSPADSALPPGVVDEQYARSQAAAVSPTVVGLTTVTADERQVEGDCWIAISTIRNIAGAHVEVTPGETDAIEVDLTADITGLVDKPKPEFEVYVAINSTVDGRTWVLDQKGTRAGRRWTETGYFGREGLDYGEWYRLYAVVSKRRLRHGAYSADAFRRVEQDFCASSAEVLVQRRVGPGDLVIQRVDEIRVAGKEVLDISDESQVHGSMRDPKPENALRINEHVWILSRPEGRVGWTVAALAAPLPDRLSWRVPAVRFPDRGPYTLVAISTVMTKLDVGATLTEHDWYRLVNEQSARRLSNLVKVNVHKAVPAEGGESQ